MKNMKRILLTMVAAMLLVVMSVGGTLAYLASKTAVVQNTFSVGDIVIELWETDVDNDTTATDNWTYKGVTYDRANAYKLLPNQTYAKDPTVFVAKGSEEAYLRMIVTVGKYDQLIAAFDEKKAEYVVDGVFLLQNVVDWNTVWAFEKCEVAADGKTATYEFRYNGSVNTLNETEDFKVMPALFTEITMPEFLDNDAIDKLNGVTIDVEAHAIQTAGFDSVEAAWAGFDAAVPAVKQGQ